MIDPLHQIDGYLIRRQATEPYVSKKLWYLYRMKLSITSFNVRMRKVQTLTDKSACIRILRDQTWNYLQWSAILIASTRSIPDVPMAKTWERMILSDFDAQRVPDLGKLISRNNFHDIVIWQWHELRVNLKTGHNHVVWYVQQPSYSHWDERWIFESGDIQIRCRVE